MRIDRGYIISNLASGLGASLLTGGVLLYGYVEPALSALEQKAAGVEDSYRELEKETREIIEEAQASIDRVKTLEQKLNMLAAEQGSDGIISIGARVAGKPSQIYLGDAEFGILFTLQYGEKQILAPLLYLDFGGAGVTRERIMEIRSIPNGAYVIATGYLNQTNMLLKGIQKSDNVN